MFIAKRNASIGFGGYLSALPYQWNAYNQIQIRHMAINLDLDKSGFIHWRVMFTYFLLLKSCIPNDAQIKAFKDSCKIVDGFVMYDSFIKAQFWFDKTEASIQRPNSHFFDRVFMIKDQLFKTHCQLVPNQSDAMVDVESFCNILQTPLVQHPKVKFADYCEFLFAPVTQI